MRNYRIASLESRMARKKKRKGHSSGGLITLRTYLALRHS